MNIYRQINCLPYKLNSPYTITLSPNLYIYRDKNGEHILFPIILALKDSLILMLAKFHILVMFEFYSISLWNNEKRLAWSFLQYTSLVCIHSTSFENNTTLVNTSNALSMFTVGIDRERSGCWISVNRSYCV